MPYLYESNASAPVRFLIPFEPEEANNMTPVLHETVLPSGRISLLMLASQFVGQPLVLDLSDTDDSQVTQSYTKKFERLARSWKESIGPTSSIHKMSMHSSYQQIIAMGYPAVSLILEELQREPNHWFWALRVITGADPVQLENQGNIREMANDWLTWGRNRGFI